MIIQITAVTKFFETFFSRIKEGEKENCSHVVLCDCLTWNSMVNRLVEDFYKWNHESQFWNPIVLIQLGFPGMFFGVILSLFF
jgi:hypothetical protein